MRLELRCPLSCWQGPIARCTGARCRGRGYVAWPGLSLFVASRFEQSDLRGAEPRAAPKKRSATLDPPANTEPAPSAPTVRPRKRRRPSSPPMSLCGSLFNRLRVSMRDSSATQIVSCLGELMEVRARARTICTLNAHTMCMSSRPRSNRRWWWMVDSASWCGN